MQPTNPYAGYAPPPPPPLYRQNVRVPEGAATAPLLGTGIRVAKLVLGIVQTVALLVGLGLFVTGAVLSSRHGAGQSGDVFFATGAGFFALWEVALIAYAIVSMVWAYKFWSWIPPEHRHTSLWKRYISPRQAALFMLIPYFNIFWIIVLNIGTAEILDRMRVAYPSNKPSAKTIALINTIVPFVFFPASPFLDYVFDKHVEGIATDMQAQMTGPPRAG